MVTASDGLSTQNQHMHATSMSDVNALRKCMAAREGMKTKVTQVWVACRLHQEGCVLHASFGATAEWVHNVASVQPGVQACVIQDMVPLADVVHLLKHNIK